MERREYVQKLKEFTKEKGLSIYEYYLAYALTVRSNKRFVLPDFELNNPFLTAEDIKKLLECQDPRIVEYYALAMEKVISLQTEELTRQEVVEVVDEKLNETISRKDVEEIIDDKLGETISRQDVKEAVDEKLAETDVLGREDIIDVINEHLDRDLTRDGIQEVINENMDKQPIFKVVITSIGRKIADLLNGFAVVREEKTGRAHLYHHDAKTDSLKGEKVFINNQLKVDSGYYVNYQEYIDQMLDEIVAKYPAPEEIRFVRDDQEERSLNEVLEEAFAILMQQGALRFGKELQGKKITTYKELRSLQLEGTEEYANEPLKVGVYVRRDVLTRIFARYHAKVTVMEEDNKQPIK